MEKDIYFISSKCKTKLIFGKFILFRVEYMSHIFKFGVVLNLLWLFEVQGPKCGNRDLKGIPEV